MKRFVCVCLALVLLAAVPAAAEEPDWAWFESEFGLSFSYDAGAFGVGVNMDGDVLVYPLALAEGAAAEGGDGFVLTWKDPKQQACIRFANPYNESKPEGWTPPPDFVPLDEDADWALPGWIASRVVEDEIIGPYTCDEVIFEGTDSLFLLSVAYPEDDPDGWGEWLWETVEMMELPPQPAAAGSFRLDFFYGGAAGMQFIPVTVDEDAEPVVLRANREVRDFVLEQLIWDEDAFEVTGAEPLYTADVFGPGDNLEIFCYFPDVLPALRVRCVNADGEAESWDLFQSGRDGSLLLIDAEEP